MHLEAWAPAGIFAGGASPKKAPLKTKKAPPKKNWRGLGGMLPREKFNNGAPYDTLDASQQGRI